MEYLGYALIAIGVILGLVYTIQLIILAFRTSIWWGLGFLFVPLVNLIFVFMHWSQAKKPFLMILLAAVLAGVGGALAGPALQKRLPAPEAGTTTSPSTY